MTVSVKRDFMHLCVQQWRSHGKRGIWLRLNLAQAQFISIAANAGFDFKHAQKGHVIMTKWLSSDIPDLLPDSATHQVRCSFPLSMLTTDRLCYIAYCMALPKMSKSRPQ